MVHSAVHVPEAKVALSTASVYPESTASAFEIAARLGYDGVEVMVWTDPVSQDIEALRRLSDFHGVPVLAVHSPCLLITQRVWSTDPWVKLQRARYAAERLGAETVVVHPPFRWQRSYAREFVDGVWRMANETDVRFAVENMYPWRYRDREMLAYAPDWDPTQDDYRHFTIDLSHTATSRSDPLAMVERMGDRLGHVHIADGMGSNKDEHLVPGRGNQPCAELLGALAGSGFDGHVVVEVNTRRAMSAAEREADLAEALAFTRLHLAADSADSADSAHSAAASPGAEWAGGHPGASPEARPPRAQQRPARRSGQHTERTARPETPTDGAEGPAEPDAPGPTGTFGAAGVPGAARTSRSRRTPRLPRAPRGGAGRRRGGGGTAAGSDADGR